MIIPIRCFSCNKEISSKWDRYEDMLKNGINIKEALNNAGLIRYCCRRMFLGHVDLVDKVIQYDYMKDVVDDE